MKTSLSTRTRTLFSGGGTKLNEGEIERFDLDSEYINRPIYNDVSYLTGDNRLIILIEHQSAPNPNMPARMMLYYAELVRQWLTAKGKDLNSNAKVDLPQPEYYVAYQWGLY